MKKGIDPGWGKKRESWWKRDQPNEITKKREKKKKLVEWTSCSKWGNRVNAENAGTRGVRGIAERGRTSPFALKKIRSPQGNWYSTKRGCRVGDDWGKPSKRGEVGLREKT